MQSTQRHRRLISGETHGPPHFIVMVAVAASHLARLAASFAVRCNSVFGHMVFMARHYLKIFGSIVRAIVIDVVNSLPRLKKSSYFSFNNNNVLKYLVVMFIPSRMISVSNQNISVLCGSFPRLVKREIFGVISDVLLPAFPASRKCLVPNVCNSLSASHASLHSVILATGSQECKTI